MMKNIDSMLEKYKNYDCFLYRLWKTFRYWWALNVEVPIITYFPDGGRYVCPYCDRTFTTYFSRNVHEWRMHPGCPKYRKYSFKDWNMDHSFRCKPEECTRSCYNGQSPYRRN